MRRIAGLSVAAAGLVAVGAALVVLQVMGGQQARSGSVHRANACSPAPCADAGGYRMRVVGVQSGQGLVTVQVSFTVKGRTRMHAVPEDFRLVEAGGSSDDPWFDDGAQCPKWPRTNIPDGGQLSPKTLCFRPKTTAGRLVLHWNPGLGPIENLSSGWDVPLPAPSPSGLSPTPA